MPAQKDSESPAYRILAIEAHPDDMAYFYGGTVAKLVAEGHAVRVVTVTTGDQSTLDPALSAPDVAQTLAEEHARVMDILGVSDQRFLSGYTNHFLYASSLQLQLREELIREVRTYRPDTVICFDPADVHEENPDHVMLARVALEAAAFAAYPLVHPEHAEQDLDPHYVARMLMTPTPAPDLFVDITGPPLEKKMDAGAAYPSQLDLMFSEIDQRLRTLGLDPDLADIGHEALWRSVCESMATETAQHAREFYQHHPDRAPRVPPDHAEGFRLYFFGALGRVSGLLPKEYLTL